MGLKWIATSGNNIPKSAVEAGFERNGSPLFIARAWNSKDGQWTPGKAAYHLRGGCHFPYDGDENISYNYEVLTRDNGMSSSPSVPEWRSCNSIYPNTKRAICTSSSAGLFVSRGYYRGSLIPGKFDTIHRNNYVSYGGKEYTCDEYEILYEKPLTVYKPPPMKYDSPSFEGKVTKYQHDFYGINTSLQTGMVNLADYVKNVKGAFQENKDGFKFIKTTIYPPVNRAKEDFDSMCDRADKLVEKVNRDVEFCVQELANKERTIKNLNKEIDQLRIGLDGKKREVAKAKERLRRKQGELAKAEEAFQIARDQLQRAKEERKIFEIVGGILIFFGPIGLIAGSATIDAVQQKENACKENRDDASSVVWSSKQSLNEAKNSRWKTETEISDRTYKKQAKEKYLSDLRKAVDGLRRYQRNIIDLDESVKNINKELTEFCGKIEVLHVETDGGYLLELLKKPTDNVLDALKKLGETEAITLICSPTEVEELKASVLEVESIQWSTAPAIDI